MSDDPFRWMVYLCHVSSSQEDLLRVCPFVGESDDPPLSDTAPDSGEMPLEATGITMVSLPENWEENEIREQFHTPPEESLVASSGDLRAAAVDQVPDDDGDGETLAADGDCTDGEATVDLGRDTDLGFSEVEPMQKFNSQLNAETSRGVDGAHESEVFHSESEPVRFLTRKLSPNEGLGESPLKKIIISGKNLGYESIDTEKLFKSFEKLKSEVVGPYKRASPRVCLSTLKEKNRENLLNSLEKSKTDDRDSVHVDGNKFRHQTNEYGAENLRKEPVGTETGESNEASGYVEERAKDGLASSEVVGNGLCNKVTGEANTLYSNNDSGRKRAVEIDKFRYIGPSPPDLHHKVEKNVQMKRVLPVSISRPEMNSGTSSPRILQKITLLDVLKILADRCRSDPDLENLSILEVAKRRGMTFP